MAQPVYDAMDEGFLDRVQKTTISLAVVLTLMLVQTLNVPVTAGFFAGALIGIASLKMSAWSIKWALKNPESRSQFAPICVTGVKLGLVYAVLRYLIGAWSLSIPALAAGLSLVVLVIGLKAVGIYLLQFSASASSNQAS